MAATAHRVRLAALALALALVADEPFVRGVRLQPDRGDPYDQLRIIAPAAPGGGWDQVARVMQQALQRDAIVRVAPVENIPGAAGTIGLARFVSAEPGNEEIMMVTGLVMLGAILTHASPVTLRDVTPIARLIGEYEVIAVPAGSPFRTLRDLIEAFQRRPESVSWAGGSAGGTDHILAGLIAEAVGVAPRRVNYIAFSGGGEAVTAVLGEQVSAGVSGLAEFEAQIAAGSLRVLAISSAERLPGVDVPTLREQGIDVELENWRAVVAAPGVSAEARDRLTATMEAMVRSADWRAALARYRWSDRYLGGEPFDRFLRAEESRVQAILGQLGTQAVGTAAGKAVATYPMFVLLGLAIFGLAAAVESIRTSHRDMAQRAASKPRWQPIVLVAAGMALHLFLLQRAGFILASTVLFWFTARAFDDCHPVRDAIFAAGVSSGCYLLFDRVLQLSLPAGLLG